MTDKKETARSRNSLSEEIELMKDRRDGIHNLEELLLKLLENVQRLLNDNNMLNEKKLEEILQNKSKSRKKSKKHQKQKSLNLNCELCDFRFKILNVKSVRKSL